MTQLKIYQAARFGKLPGNNFIQYSPHSPCGGTTINIKNWATASLYTYTPYQPNAAALRAGYGLGDSCSSYGNRNFYNYYTDWFGSTQASTAQSMVMVGSNVFLISGANRYPIGPSLLGEYRSIFGAPIAVSADYADRFTLKPKATAFIRDASNGRVAMLSGSRSHHFGSCALVAAWGGLCNTEVSLTNADYNRIPAGDRMSWFARTSAGGAIHSIEGQSLHPYFDTGSAATANGGVAPFAPVMTSEVLARYSVGGTVQFAPANFIVLSDTSRVWLPTADARLVYLPSWTVAEELGLPSAAYRHGISPSVVSNFSQQDRLEYFVECGDQAYHASRGTLHAVSPEAAAGFDAVPLDSKTCAKLDRSGDDPLAKLFVRAVGGSEVYIAQNGIYHHVASPSMLREFGGGSLPVILPMSGASVDRLTKGEPIRPTPPQPSPGVPFTPGEFFTATGSSRVYLPLSNAEALYLPSWVLAAELGLPASTRRTIDASLMNSIRQSGVLSQWVTCDETTYFAAQGTLYPVTGEAAAGFAVAGLDAATCGTFVQSSQQPLEAVFVSGGGPAVYLAENGVMRHVTSPSRLLALGGGTRPTVLNMSSAMLSRYAQGPNITATSD